MYFLSVALHPLDVRNEDSRVYVYEHDVEFGRIEHYIFYISVHHRSVTAFTLLIRQSLHYLLRRLCMHSVRHNYRCFISLNYLFFQVSTPSLRVYFKFYTNICGY